MTATMQTYGLASLPQTSRVWVFQSSELLTGALAEAVCAELDAFITQWAAHGRQLFAAFEVRHARFIVIAVNQHHEAASGCSIDSMMRCIQQLDTKHNLRLLDRMKVAYRDAQGAIHECSVPRFREMLSTGEATREAIVFNNVVATLADLETQWEVPVGRSWLI